LLAIQPRTLGGDHRIGMQFPHIQKLDLNLLLSFQALIEERNITHAGQRMGLTQTAMSRVFDRLQEMLGDDLLVRTAKGYIPTRRALDLYSRLSGLLPEIEEVLRGKQFNPAEATDTFRIAATDHTALLIIPRLFHAVSRIAPGIQFNVSALEPDVVAKLETNAIDLAFRIDETPQTLRSAPLYRDNFVCLMRKGHPLARRPLTMKRYLDQQHIAISPWPMHIPRVDRALERLGYRRKVRVVVPYFCSVVPLIEGSDLIATLSKHIAKHLAASPRVRMVRPPLEVEDCTMFQIWHPRSDSDPAHKWLRDVVRKIATSIGV
jgi:DNA-binding transcriptional LysR family regulator